jgi:hypothetical protein
MSKCYLLSSEHGRRIINFTCPSQSSRFVTPLWPGNFDKLLGTPVYRQYSIRGFNKADRDRESYTNFVTLLLNVYLRAQCDQGNFTNW